MTVPKWYYCRKISSSTISTNLHSCWRVKNTRIECSFNIFPTRFECSFRSSPLVSSVVLTSFRLVSSVVSTSFRLVSSVFLHLLHSFRVYFYIFSTRFECSFAEYKRVSSMVKPVASSLLKPHLDNLEYQLRPGEKIHSKRVRKIPNHTRNEWRRYKITLETSGEDTKLHSLRVENKVWST